MRYLQSERNFNIFKGNPILLFSFVLIFILSFVGKISAINSVSIQEVLSVRTGKEPAKIKNQFVGATIDPYKGFAVDSKGNIFISDTVNHRIMRFSKDGKLTDLLIGQDRPLFWPLKLCLTEDDFLYAHNEEKEEIIVFLPDGQILRSFSPAYVFDHKKKKVSILSLSCNRKTVKVVYGADEVKMIRPVYEDEYDQDFKLINRKDYDTQVVYYQTLEKSNQGFEKRFEDLWGNTYGYRMVEERYSQFLPLQKHSPEGKLLGTIDSSLLTKHSKYKVYDYYTGRNKLVLDLQYMKGNDYMIATWYVTPSGIIYALIANTEYVKVLKIEENQKPADEH